MSARMAARFLPACSVLALSLGAAAPALAEGEINALIWCDHADPKLLEPFEKAHDVRVNVKEYEGTAAGLAILDQSRPGDWDVMVIDAVDVGRAVDRGLLAPLPVDQLAIDDQFPQIQLKDANGRDGKTYAITEKFGYNTIAYDKSKVDEADMQDLTTLWSGKYDSRIAIYDYYLPVIGLVGLEQGVATKDLDATSLEALREPLFALKGASRQVSDVVASQTALATGEVDVLFGGGEWLTAVLASENPNLDWTIPKQGALVWAQSIAVLKDSQNPDMALEFVKYITSPEGQAQLATSECYWGMPANMKTGSALTDAQKKILRWDDQKDYLARAQLYPVPDAELDLQMQDLWTDMLQN